MTRLLTRLKRPLCLLCGHDWSGGPGPSVSTCLRCQGWRRNHTWNATGPLGSYRTGHLPGPFEPADWQADNGVECLLCAEQSDWLINVMLGVGCNKPPEGWFCTRPRGHRGPCAARRRIYRSKGAA